MTGRPTRLIPDPVSATAGNLVASRLISVYPIKLLSLTVTNTKGTTQYILMFRAVSLPPEDTVPCFPAIPVASASVTSIDFGSSGLDLDCLYVTNSSTPEKKTIGSADCQILAVVAA